MTDEKPDLIIARKPITMNQLRELAAMRFGDMVKAVVDTRLRIVALGGDLHSDQETELLEQGSHQSHLWGINIYPDKPRNEWVEFDSVINIRPSRGNRSRMSSMNPLDN